MKIIFLQGSNSSLGVDTVLEGYVVQESNQKHTKFSFLLI